MSLRNKKIVTSFCFEVPHNSTADPGHGTACWSGQNWSHVGHVSACSKTTTVGVRCSTDDGRRTRAVERTEYKLKLHHSVVSDQRDKDEKWLLSGFRDIIKGLEYHVRRRITSLSSISISLLITMSDRNVRYLQGKSGDILWQETIWPLEDMSSRIPGRPFGMASFTEDDLSALSRRKMAVVIPSERTTTGPPYLARRSSMTPLEECDDESIISAVPTGLRAQQEILSALQKENFRLKLSLHSHRRKETIQNARLESTSSALQDIELRKNGLEKTLKTLKGEIIAGYRNLEKLVSEQLEGDKPAAAALQSDDRSSSSSSSSSRGSSKQEVKVSVVNDQVNGLILDIQKKTTRTSATSPTTPTRRYIIESRNDKQPPDANNTTTPRNNNIKSNHTPTKPQSRTKRTTKHPNAHNTAEPQNQNDTTDPWIIDIDLNNQSPPNPPINPIPQEKHNQAKPLLLLQNWNRILQKLSRSLHISRGDDTTTPRLPTPSTKVDPNKNPFNLFRTANRKTPRRLKRSTTTTTTNSKPRERRLGRSIKRVFWKTGS